jgi:hypothetical protein
VTKDDVQTLSGRALDEAVAEQIMGWHRDAEIGGFAIYGQPPGTYDFAKAWHPSTDITQAMQVAEQAGVFHYGWCLGQFSDGTWVISRLTAEAPYLITSTTPAEALLRACLLVMEANND